MALTIKMLNVRGECASRDELASLFAADMDYVPYRRRAEISREGVITLTIPGSPVVLQAKLLVPGYGLMWISADNCGAGYRDGAGIEFVREAALSRVHAVDGVIAGGEFQPSIKCGSLLEDARAMLKLAEEFLPAGRASSAPGAAAKAGELHITALAAAMWAGELAVVERARSRIAKKARRDNFLFGSAGFDYPYQDGCEYPFPDMPNTKYVFDQVFNYATLPFYLALVEPERGKPNYAHLDRLLDYFEKAGIQTKGHPLWWAHTAGMPPWTRDLKWADGSIRRELERVIGERARRYRGRIRIYDIINEAHDWCNAWMMTQGELAEMTKACADALHNAEPGCAAVVNTCFMFGENAADGRVQWGIVNERNMVPYSYLQRLAEIDTQYEIIGMQLYCPSRDMLAIDQLYDRFKVFGKPYHITELGVPSHDEDVPPNTTEGDIYCLRYMYRGLWHEMEWNERLQADWIEDFYTLSYARPEIEGLTWWSVRDMKSYVPAAGIVSNGGIPKEGFYRLKALEKSWGFDFGSQRR